MTTALAIEPGCVVQHTDGRLGLCYRQSDGFVYVSTTGTDGELESRCWPAANCSRDGDIDIRTCDPALVDPLCARIRAANREALA